MNYAEPVKRVCFWIKKGKIIVDRFSLLVIPQEDATPEQKKLPKVFKKGLFIGYLRNAKFRKVDLSLFNGCRIEGFCLGNNGQLYIFKKHWFSPGETFGFEYIDFEIKHNEVIVDRFSWLVVSKERNRKGYTVEIFKKGIFIGYFRENVATHFEDMTILNDCDFFGITAKNKFGLFKMFNKPWISLGPDYFYKQIPFDFSIRNNNVDRFSLLVVQKIRVPRGKEWPKVYLLKGNKKILKGYLRPFGLTLEDMKLFNNHCIKEKKLDVGGNLNIFGKKCWGHFGKENANKKVDIYIEGNKVVVDRTKLLLISAAEKNKMKKDLPAITTYSKEVLGFLLLKHHYLPEDQRFLKGLYLGHLPINGKLPLKQLTLLWEKESWADKTQFLKLKDFKFLQTHAKYFLLYLKTALNKHGPHKIPPEFYNKAILDLNQLFSLIAKLTMPRATPSPFRALSYETIDSFFAVLNLIRKNLSACKNRPPEINRGLKKLIGRIFQLKKFAIKRPIPVPSQASPEEE
ncbi:MAG: hypothetical protein KKA19_08720 [Candidatus Margulisbacteria bacterium]|nr:hypothetical protein [Candidatus Margulisiibacteriota bacterium]